MTEHLVITNTRLPGWYADGTPIPPSEWPRLANDCTCPLGKDHSESETKVEE